MYLIGLHTRAQGGINLLVARDETFALEGVRHNRGIPMAPVTFERNMRARQAGGNQGLELFCGHGTNKGLAANFVTGAQQVQGNGKDQQHGATHHCEA